MRLPFVPPKKPGKHTKPKQSLLIALLLLFLGQIATTPVSAQTPTNCEAVNINTLSADNLDCATIYGDYSQWDPLYSACSVDTTSTTSSDAAPSNGSNRDYAGRPILTQGQLQAIAQNQSVYQQAAQQVGIPWQMLAVIHLRESGLKVANPGNGQGIFQFPDHRGGPYPTGPVSQQEFLRQAVLAAQELKDDAKRNYSGHQNLSIQSDADTIKDTFFSYNGRASAYEQQAAKLGFGSNKGYEGSPYVMNKADAKRDPDALGKGETTWGQIKTDHGPIVYPANGDYGAFVTYAALTGIPLSGGCASGTVNCSQPANSTAGLSTVRQNVVCITQQELQKWTSGQLKPANGYLAYSQNAVEEWCADFVSWVYDQAKYPLKPDPSWRVPSVDGVRAIGNQNKNFHWHNAGGYTPRPGDIVVHKEGMSHVNIVVGVSGSSMTLIGGDQGHGPYPGGSSVTQYTDKAFSGVDGITGYVTPD